MAALSKCGGPTNLPKHLLDPVTFDPLLRAVSLVPCGHSLNEDTARLLQSRATQGRQPLCPIERCAFREWTNNYSFRHVVEVALNPAAKATDSAARSVLNSQSQTDRRSSEAVAFLEQGKKLLTDGFKEKAVEAFLKALELQPEFEKAQAYLDVVLNPPAPSEEKQPSSVGHRAS